MAEELRGPVDVRDGLSETVRRVLEAVPVRRSAGVAALAREAGVSALVVQQSCRRCRRTAWCSARRRAGG
jgi:hypothetical protein